MDADGAPGPWTPAGALPSGRKAHACVILGGFLHVIGGTDEAGGTLGNVLVARIMTDGTLGPFAATTPLPSLGA